MGRMWQPISSSRRACDANKTELLAQKLGMSESALYLMADACRHDDGVKFLYDLRHFNTARPHRSLQQLAPARAETQPPTPIDLADHRVRRRPILAGLTSEYEIAA